MAKTGRPTSYSPEIAGSICDEIATTDHGLERICRGNGMPDVRTVYRWLEVNEDFRQRYERERERQADVLASQILEIGDDGTNDPRVARNRNPDSELCGCSFDAGRLPERRS